MLEKKKAELKERLAENTNEALTSLQKVLKPNTSNHDAVILLLEQWNRVNQAFQQGLVDFNDADLKFNRIASGTLDAINNLKKEDLLTEA